MALPCSAISDSACIAACHSSASCSACGSFVMYCAASRSVISGFRPGNGIGLSNFASYSNSNPTEPGFRCETLDRFLSRKPRLAVDAKPEVEGSTQGSGTADENSIDRPCSHIRIQYCSRRRVRPKPDRQHYKIVTMPSMPSVSMPSMPDLSMPDFSDAVGRLMTEFNTFTQQVAMHCRSSDRWVMKSPPSKSYGAYHQRRGCS